MQVRPMHHDRGIREALLEDLASKFARTPTLACTRQGICQASRRLSSSAITRRSQSPKTDPDKTRQDKCKRLKALLHSCFDACPPPDVPAAQIMEFVTVLPGGKPNHITHLWCRAGITGSGFVGVWTTIKPICWGLDCKPFTDRIGPRP